MRASLFGGRSTRPEEIGERPSALFRVSDRREQGGVRPLGGALAVAFVCAALWSCRGAERRAPPSIPRRVVTLAPNLTEIVFALGAQDRLVAVSDFSDYPAAARSLARVGGLDSSAERIVSLHPDLVLASRDGNPRGAVQALEAAGIPVLTVSGGSLDAVLEGIRLVAQRLGRLEEGERLAAALSRRRDEVGRNVAGRSRPAAVLLVWPDPPQAAGGGTFLSDVLEEAGAQNLLADRVGWPVVSAEFLATAPIDVLVLPESPETRGVFERARVSGALSRGAAARARVIRLDEAALTRPGPRIFDALESLARELHRPTGSPP
jgi:cobalamin transport system substrate-binding protein